MCRSLFCKSLEHTDRFSSSGNLLSCSVFGQTLVLPISPQFPETLAVEIPWLKPVRASFVRSILTAKAIKAGSEGHWALSQWQQWQVLPWLPQLRGRPHVGQLASSSSFPGKRVVESLPVGCSWHCLAGGEDGRGPTCSWFKCLGILLLKLIEKQAAEKESLSSKANQRWKPEIYIQIFSPFPFPWIWDICSRERKWNEMN